MVVDCFTYNGESEILKLHLGTLYDSVDQFIICEAKTTFSGKPKPLYFSEQEPKFRKWWKKIKYHIIDENYTQAEIDFAAKSPNTQGAEHWKREFLQKERIKQALTHLNDDDIVFVGDVDEIWEDGTYVPEIPSKLKLRVYTYYLNNRSNEEFWGTLVARYKDIRKSCLNHLRTNAFKARNYGGWHFTSMGGTEELQRKLEDSYTDESYATQGVLQNLAGNYGTRDFLGRNFTYTLDESEWPEYLKNNKKQFSWMMNSQ